MAKNPAFDLPAELTIYTATETRESMLGWIKTCEAGASGPLLISARDVEAVDGAGLQLLAALLPMDLEWSISDPSPPFAKACGLAGLLHWLPDGVHAEER